MNPLLEPIEDEDQIYLLDLLAKTFRERGHWPNWQFVEAMLERRGADPVGLVASLPSIGVQQGIYGFSYGLTWTRGSFGSLYRPEDPIGLTIAGWHQVGASEVVSLFLALLRLANRRLDDFVPEPDRVVVTELSSADFKTELAETSGVDRRQLYEILEAEPAMLSGNRWRSQDGEWRWELSKPLRRYRDLTTIEGYIEAVTAFAEEVANEVKRLPIVQAFTAPSSTLVQDVSAVEEYTGAVELGDPSATSDAPVLFLSWGGSTAKVVAAVLKPVLEDKLAGVNVFFSPTSIEPGDDPQDRLFDQGLLGSHALVAVLTREGAGRPYVIWETAAAWGRGKLVVPMFVDIEAGDVPGPLTTKVQGVRLGDRADVVRAVARLQSDFSVSGPSELSNHQWASLETAVLAAKAGPFAGKPALTPPPLPGALSPPLSRTDWDGDRRAAERQEAKRQRLLKVAGLIEDMFPLLSEKQPPFPKQSNWDHARRRLALELEGFSDIDLPQCRFLVSQTARRIDERSLLVLARDEVVAAVKMLANARD